MPMRYSLPTGTRKLEFWITSSRGTDRRVELSVPAEWTDDQIKDELEEWCSQFGAWSHSDNYVRYGWNDETDFGSRK